MSEEEEGIFADCLKECEKVFAYRACFIELEKTEFFSLVQGGKESRGITAFLEGKEKVVLFAATVGIEIDRLILRYANTSPVKALFFQAIGAERIEKLCDRVCQEFGEEVGRFSAGYGDFSLSAQADIFRILQPQRYIGLSLTDALMMTPTKSVTAIIGK